MVAGGGKGKTGKQYNYYECKKKKKRLCDKKIEHKHALEDTVVKSVICFLSDKNNLDIIVKDVLNYYDQRTDETQIKSIRKRISLIKEEADEAANAFISAKSQLLKDRIEKRMQECELLINDLENQKIQLELERGRRLTADDIKEFANMILKGDLNDIEFKRRLIDNLVYRVYVSDKKTIIFFNIRGGRHIEEVTSEDTKDILDNSETFLTPSDLACHRIGHKKLCPISFCESS